MPSGKATRKVRRLMSKEAVSADWSPLFRLSVDEKGNLETYVTAPVGLGENTAFFFLTGI